LRRSVSASAASLHADQKLRFIETDHSARAPGLAAVVPELLFGPMPV
jgi:hypothetical protein